MKTLYNSQQHEVPTDVTNGIHRANCRSLWDPSVCNQETGLLLLELKLVSSSGLLHFFVLGAVCKGRQRGWYVLRDSCVVVRSLGIFPSCLFLNELLLYELHIIVYRYLPLELQINYRKLSPFLRMSDSTGFLQVSVLCACQYWDFFLLFSCRLLPPFTLIKEVILYIIIIIMCCCSFFSYDCLSSSNLVSKTVQSTHPAMLACRAEKDWTHHTRVTCII